jgi:hypothetical protein
LCELNIPINNRTIHQNQTIYQNQTVYQNNTVNQTITQIIEKKIPATFFEKYGIALIILVIAVGLIIYFRRKK